MKSFAFVAFLFSTFININAQSVNFLSDPFARLQEKAKTENKFLFIDCMTDWCIWCKVMDKETFHNENVASLMNANFVSSQIDMEKDYGIRVAMKYRVTGFPTFLIFDAAGKLVYRGVGYQKADEFLVSLKTAMNPATQQNYTGITPQIELDFPQFYKDAFGGKAKSIKPDDKTVNNFLTAQKDVTNEVAWSVMSRFKTSEENNQYFLNNIERYRTLYSIEADEHLQAIIGRKLNDAISMKSEKQYEEVGLLIDKHLIKNKKEIKEQYALQFYSGTGNWKNFTSSFEKYLSEKGYANVGIINEYSWAIYEKCNDAELITKAAFWMKQATASTPEYAYLDTYAALLYKNRNYTEAATVAIDAIEKGKAEKQDIKGTEDLLKKIKEAQAK